MPDAEEIHCGTYAPSVDGIHVIEAKVINILGFVQYGS